MLTTSPIVTYDMPMFTGGMSAFPYSSALEARYVFKTNFGDLVNMSERKGNTLFVPRETAPISKIDHRVKFEPAAINCNFVPRFPEQGTTVEQSIALLNQGRNHIFQAPTGYGKTVCGSVIACRMGQPTMIIVTKDDLVQQWRAALINVLGVPSHLVGHVQQNTCDWQGRRFVIGMVHSLIIPGRYPAEMYRAFGLVEFDEAHMMATDCFIEACKLFPAHYRLAFSATPDRKDGKTKMLHAHIGPTLVKGTVVAMKPKVIVRNTGWKIPRRMVYDKGVMKEKPIPHGPGKMMLVVKAMASNPHRNLEITNFVKQAYKADRNVLVMAELIEDHLEKLFHLLVKEGIPGHDIGFYCGGRSKTELQLAKKRRVCLATYQMCSTGTDVPQWDSLIFATPRSDVEQAGGRILRSLAGKKQPIICDLVDAENIYLNFHRNRLKYYYRIGAEVVAA